MSKVHFIYRAAVLAFIVCFITVPDAYAEEVESREIVVTSVSLEVDSQINTALFKGSVVAKVDYVTIYADSMKVSYSDAEKNVVEIHAVGNVRVSNEEKVIFSREAQYLREEEKIIFTGTPKVVEGENIITGTKIIYFLNDDRAIVEGSKVVLKNVKTGDIMHTLEASALKKSYNGKNIVSDISLNICSGEVVGLLGPNGAGKTTTFHMILGMVSADDGIIYLDGERLNDFPMYKRARKGLGYLPQETSIFRKLSVKDNIMAVLEMTDIPVDEKDRKLRDIIEEFNLLPFSERTGYQLSGGECRRVEIARALALDPLFILLDEPFAGIDPLAVIELKNTFNSLKERGIGLIITDHNVRDTLSITDRAYIISDGRILSHGIPEELVADVMVKKSYLGEEFSL